MARSEGLVRGERGEQRGRHQPGGRPLALDQLAGRETKGRFFEFLFHLKLIHHCTLFRENLMNCFSGTNAEEVQDADIANISINRLFE